MSYYSFIAHSVSALDRFLKEAPVPHGIDGDLLFQNVAETYQTVCGENLGLQSSVNGGVRAQNEAADGRLAAKITGMSRDLAHVWNSSYWSVKYVAAAFERSLDFGFGCPQASPTRLEYEYKLLTQQLYGRASTADDTNSRVYNDAAAKAGEIARALSERRIIKNEHLETLSAMVLMLEDKADEGERLQGRILLNEIRLGENREVEFMPNVHDFDDTAARLRLLLIEGFSHLRQGILYSDDINEAQRAAILQAARTSHIINPENLPERENGEAVPLRYIAWALMVIPSIVAALADKYAITDKNLPHFEKILRFFENEATRKIGYELLYLIETDQNDGSPLRPVHFADYLRAALYGEDIFHALVNLQGKQLVASFIAYLILQGLWDSDENQRPYYEELIRFASSRRLDDNLFSLIALAKRRVDEMHGLWMEADTGLLDRLKKETDEILKFLDRPELAPVPLLMEARTEGSLLLSVKDYIEAKVFGNVGDGSGGEGGEGGPSDGSPPSGGPVPPITSGPSGSSAAPIESAGDDEEMAYWEEEVVFSDPDADYSYDFWGMDLPFAGGLEVYENLATF